MWIIKGVVTWKTPSIVCSETFSSLASMAPNALKIQGTPSSTIMDNAPHSRRQWFVRLSVSINKSTQNIRSSGKCGHEPCKLHTISLLCKNYYSKWQYFKIQLSIMSAIWNTPGQNIIVHGKSVTHAIYIYIGGSFNK